MLALESRRGIVDAECCRKKSFDQIREEVQGEIGMEVQACNFLCLLGSALLILAVGCLLLLEQCSQTGGKSGYKVNRSGENELLWLGKGLAVLLEFFGGSISRCVSF